MADTRDEFRRFEEMMNRMFEEVIAWAEMPGLEKENIKINLTEDRLEISAETKQEEEKKDRDYVYREMRSGNYYRAFTLPSQVRG